MGIRDWFLRARSADERAVETEIEFHIDRATQENLAKGAPPAEARAEAIRRFGDLDRIRRECLRSRRRELSRPVAWAAVAALAAVSYLAGHLASNRGVAVATSPPRSAFLLGRLERDPARFALVGAAVPVDDMLVDSIHGRIAFRKWRWRDGVPEITLDGREWFSLVSAGRIPVAELREDYRKSRGLPEGMYLDTDPGLMILENPRCVGPSVEVVLRQLKDGSELRVAWLKGRFRGK